MSQAGRNLKFGLRGSDVRLLNLGLHLLGLGMPWEQTVDNYFDEGTREEVRQFQRQFDLEADGIVGSVTAQGINADVRQRVAADDAMGQPARSVTRTLGPVDALAPRAHDIHAQFKHFSETLNGFSAALDTWRRSAAGLARRDKERLGERTALLAEDLKLQGGYGTREGARP